MRKTDDWRQNHLKMGAIAICCLLTFTTACIGEQDEGESKADAETTTVHSAFGVPPNVVLYYDASWSPTTSSWDDFKSDLFDMIDGLAPIAGYISKGVAAIEVAIAVARFLGIIKSTSEVQLLAEEVRAIATGATWQAMAAFVDAFYAKEVSAMETLADNPHLVTFASAYDTNTQDAVNAMLTGSAWERTKVGTSNDAVTDGETLKHVIGARSLFVNPSFKWKNAISARPGAGTESGLVFDWRIGGPYLLRAAVDRLLIMAKLDPDFARNHRYDTEISVMHNGVSKFYDKMRQGIQCVTRPYTYWLGARNSSFVYGCEAVCADIHTGIADVSDVTPAQSPPPSSSTGWTNTTATCDTIGTEAIQDLANRTAYSIVTQMPLYQMRALRDALYKIRNPRADLTESAPRIVDISSGKCIDTVGGSSGYGTDLVLAPCDASRPSQQWQYNRETGQIINPNWSMCIDQRWGTGTGTKVGIWGCDTPHATVPGGPANVIDNLAQKFTYSFEGGELYSAVGTTIRAFQGSVITVGFLNANSFLGWR